MTKDEALKLALEALENWLEFDPENFGEVDKKAITAIKQVLANEALERKAENARELGLNYEPEPVAWMVWGENNVPSLTFTKPSDKYVFDSLYMTAPQRTWVGLTDEDVSGLFDFAYANDEEFIRNVEAKLKEKNT